ncbi:unnamed protein product [Musa hybrid cultivar]
MHAPTRTLHRRSGSAGGATPREGSRPLASLCLPGFRTRRLARMSDSLVRVSRRVGWGAHWPMPRSHVCPRGTPMARVMSSTASTVSPRTNDPSGLRPSMQPASIRTPSRAADRLTAVPHPTEVHRRPPSASLPAISSTL